MNTTCYSSNTFFLFAVNKYVATPPSTTFSSENEGVRKKRAKKRSSSETLKLLELLESGFDALWMTEHPDHLNSAVTDNMKKQLQTALQNCGELLLVNIYCNYEYVY